MSDIVIKNIILKHPTNEQNIAELDTWVNDTANKLNVLISQVDELKKQADTAKAVKH